MAKNTDNTRAQFAFGDFVTDGIDTGETRNGFPLPYVSHADAQRWCEAEPESYRWDDDREVIIAIGFDDEETEVGPVWLDHEPFVDEDGDEVDGGNFFPISFNLDWEVVS